MTDLLTSEPESSMPFARSLSPYLEMGAYEALWDEPGASFARLAKRFASDPERSPSDFVPPAVATKYAEEVRKRFEQAGVGRFGVRVFGQAEYPDGLRDATHPVELLYYSGHWSLVWSTPVAVVGCRKASDHGVSRTRKLVKALVANGYTIASGLAMGIDTAAHEMAIAEGGKTIAVIGTPLSSVYPKENFRLQRRIAEEHLLISQVPVHRYDKHDFRWNRAFFPARNATMSALSVGTVIVEAGETSGVLIQARQALQQGRKLFILESCFHRGLKWPDRLASQGAVRVREYGDIQRELPVPSDAD